MAELDSSGSIQAVNTFGAQGLISRHTTGLNGATNASVFYAFDERGNVALRLDGSGNVLSTDLYDAFGARTGTAAPSDPWGFGAQWGYQSDAETGLVLCTNRFYDPQQGRFLTRDPLGYAGGVNLYGYVGNNPVNWSDPNGTQVAVPAPVMWFGAGMLIWWYLTHNGIHPGPIYWPFHNPTQTNLGPSPYGPSPAYIQSPRELDLPVGSKAPYPYIPPKGWHPGNDLPSEMGKNGREYKDDKGNAWRKGPPHNFPGDDFEWDVQLKGGGHLNAGKSGGNNAGVCKSK